MTKAASSNSLEEVSPQSPSCSSSTSSTEVYNSPLGQGGEIFVNDEKFDLATIGSLASPYATASNILVSNNEGVTKIGTVDFHINSEGPTEVKINHYAPAQELKENGLHKNGQVVNPDASPSEQVPKSLKQVLKERQFWLAGLLLAIMSITFLVLFFCLYNYSSPTPVPPTFGHDDNLGDDIQVIQREEWLARNPIKIEKIKAPLKMVRILHTGGSNCSDCQSCSKMVLALQGWQIGTQGMPDIAYNYLIGGDGNVYVGRGPDVVNEWQKNAIDIVYMGNFLKPYDKLTDKMDEAGKRMISRLRTEGYITPDYIVIAQNQTYNTQSPGENVYQRIVKWPHYDYGLYFQ